MFELKGVSFWAWWRADANMATHCTECCKFGSRNLGNFRNYSEHDHDTQLAARQPISPTDSEQRCYHQLSPVKFYFSQRVDFAILDLVTGLVICTTYLAYDKRLRLDLLNVTTFLFTVAGWLRIFNLVTKCFFRFNPSGHFGPHGEPHRL